MLNRHVGYYSLPFIPCARCVRLVTDRLLPDSVNGKLLGCRLVAGHLYSIYSGEQVAWDQTAWVIQVHVCVKCHQASNKDICVIT